MNQQPHLGIQRTINRPGRSSYVRTEELVCPCCGNLTRVEWQQECFNKPPITETHCEHKGCAGYFNTMDVPSFFERYGTSASLTTIYLEKAGTK